MKEKVKELVQTHGISGTSRLLGVHAKTIYRVLDGAKSPKVARTLARMDSGGSAPTGEATEAAQGAAPETPVRRPVHPPKPPRPTLPPWAGGVAVIGGFLLAGPVGAAIAVSAVVLADTMGKETPPAKFEPRKIEKMGGIEAPTDWRNPP